MVEVLVCADRAAFSVTLSPSQQRAANNIIRGLERGDCVVLRDLGSDGKTTVLSDVHRQLGGALVGVRQVLNKLAEYEPAAIEEAFLDVIDDALAKHDLVIVDDLHRIWDVVESCDYIRKCLFETVLTALLDSAAARRKKVLFATNFVPDTVSRRAHCWFIEDFDAGDFAAICSAYLKTADSARLDYEEILRFAPNLNAHQLRKAAMWLSDEPHLTTESFLEYLSTFNLVSNVDIEEVEPVTWNDLRGVDDIIEALESKIALPFENLELAARLQLKPKRGVLLAGPPGTGKTTIGRALAHRLKGKFFLVGGTMIAGSRCFYTEIDRVFAAAARNAPSIVFIDDADVIFGGDAEKGLYRYLLTKLDGLEGAGASRVCVMMTAMEPADLPMALLRSGRVELWLEMRLPDRAARAEIFRNHLAGLPPPLCDIDVSKLADASAGTTGADLKAIADDGKLLFARDRARGSERQPAEAYFLEAIASVRQNRRKYRKRTPMRLGEAERFGFGSE